jgi:hypothetical protein
MGEPLGEKVFGERGFSRRKKIYPKMIRKDTKRKERR